MDAQALTTQYAAYAAPSEEDIKSRNLAAQRLLRTWMTDESGYEEANADAIERALQVSPVSLREHPVK